MPSPGGGEYGSPTTRVIVPSLRVLDLGDICWDQFTAFTCTATLASDPGAGWERKVTRQTPLKVDSTGALEATELPLVFELDRQRWASGGAWALSLSIDAPRLTERLLVPDHVPCGGPASNRETQTGHEDVWRPQAGVVRRLLLPVVRDGHRHAGFVSIEMLVVDPAVEMARPRVLPRPVQHVETSEGFAIVPGAPCEAKLDDWQKFYGGVVTNHQHAEALDLHSYTVEFEDGDVESDLFASNIRVTGPPPVSLRIQISSEVKSKMGQIELVRGATAAGTAIASDADADADADAETEAGADSSSTAKKSVAPRETRQRKPLRLEGGDAAATGTKKAGQSEIVFTVPRAEWEETPDWGLRFVVGGAEAPRVVPVKTLPSDAPRVCCDRKDPLMHPELDVHAALALVLGLEPAPSREGLAATTGVEVPPWLWRDMTLPLVRIDGTLAGALRVSLVVEDNLLMPPGLEEQRRAAKEKLAREKLRRRQLWKQEKIRTRAAMRLQVKLRDLRARRRERMEREARVAQERREREAKEAQARARAEARARGRARAKARTEAARKIQTQQRGRHARAEATAAQQRRQRAELQRRTQKRAAAIEARDRVRAARTIQTGQRGLQARLELGRRRRARGEAAQREERRVLRLSLLRGRLADAEAASRAQQDMLDTARARYETTLEGLGRNAAQQEATNARLRGELASALEQLRAHGGDAVGGGGGGGDGDGDGAATTTTTTTTTTGETSLLPHDGGASAPSPTADQDEDDARAAYNRWDRISRRRRLEGKAPPRPGTSVRVRSRSRSRSRGRSRSPGRLAHYREFAMGERCEMLVAGGVWIEARITRLFVDSTGQGRCDVRMTDGDVERNVLVTPARMRKGENLPPEVFVRERTTDEERRGRRRRKKKRREKWETDEPSSLPGLENDGALLLGGLVGRPEVNEEEKAAEAAAAAGKDLEKDESTNSNNTYVPAEPPRVEYTPEWARQAREQPLERPQNRPGRVRQL